MLASALPIRAQNFTHSESRSFLFGCREAAERAEGYFSEHGIYTFEKDSFHSILILGRESVGRLSNGRQGVKPWTDGNGREITDFRVYRDFADRKTGEKLPLGLWHLRLSHYKPLGEISLAPSEGGCGMNISIRFETNGAMIIAILPVDSAWGYSSNGLLEREYLDGISDVLQKERPAPRAAQVHP